MSRYAVNGTQAENVTGVRLSMHSQRLLRQFESVARTRTSGVFVWYVAEVRLSIEISERYFFELRLDSSVPSLDKIIIEELLGRIGDWPAKPPKWKTHREFMRSITSFGSMPRTHEAVCHQTKDIGIINEGLKVNIHRIEGRIKLPN